MAVYTNDLRLKEIATGDESGTWGTSTNTNLGLIADAFGFGTEAITTNADVHTTTIADGSADPGRSIFLKYTGTLDSACTITIGPNTVSKLWFIENATSGSQNIIIKQGSGATVTIPAGDTKAIYSDGAGSGGAMVDAFASLNVVDLKVEDDLTVTDDLIVNGDIDLEGSIDVNGTANLDVVDIDGAVDMASTLQVDGAITSSAGATITTADNLAQLTLISTDTDSSLGPVLDLNRNPGEAGADDDFIGQIFFTGHNDAGTPEDIIYAKLTSQIKDASDGTEDGNLVAFVMSGGSRKDMMRIGPTESVFNESSNDLDFRVESNGNANMLFVDAGNDRVGVGTSTLGAGRSLTVAGGAIAVTGQNTSHSASSMVLGQDSTAISQIRFYGADTSTGGILQFTSSSSDASAGAEVMRMNASGGVTVNNGQDSNVNFIAKAGSSSNALQVDGSSGAVTINEASADADFRVESNGNANMLFVDAGSDHVNIGTSTDHGGVLNVETTGNEVNLVLACTDTDGSAGPILDLTRDAGNVPSDDDIMGTIRFRNDDTDLNMTQYVMLQALVQDVSSGTEDGRLKFILMNGGTQRNFIDMVGSTGIIFNEDSQDVDFRVEGNGEANLLFGDASTDRIGMGTNTPAARLDVVETGTATAPIRTETAGGSANTVRNQISMFSGGSNGYHISTIRSNLSNDPYGFVLTENTTERLRIDNNGSLGLNGAPISLTDNAAPGLTIASNGPFIVLKDANNSDSCNYIANNSGVLQFGTNADDGGSKVEVAQFLSTAAVFNETSANIDFRIESDTGTHAFGVDAGNDCVFVGTTTSSTDAVMQVGGDAANFSVKMDNNYGAGTALYINNTSSTSWIAARFLTAGTLVGFISVTTSATSYSQSGSDERLKENIQDWDENVLESFKNLKPKTFNFIADEEKKNQKGYIAQDLVDSFPEAYPLEPETDRYYFAPSQMVVYLMKAIQEQQEQIEELKAEVAKLKGE